MINNNLKPKLSLTFVKCTWDAIANEPYVVATDVINTYGTIFLCNVMYASGYNAIDFGLGVRVANDILYANPTITQSALNLIVAIAYIKK